MAKVKIKKVTPSVAYPSSLIQQKYNESLKDHGLIVWNLQDFSHEFVDIPNDIGYCSFKVQNGQLLDWDEQNIPPVIRAQVYYDNTNLADRKIIESFIRSKRKVIEWKIQTVKNSSDLNEITKRNYNINIRDVNTQNQLVTDFLADQNVPVELLQRVKSINQELNLRISSAAQEHSLRNTTWKPLSFEFSNMFSYGEDNIINFSNMKGIYGVFGPNASGKSTIFDAFCFCLFDKCSKTYKAKDVLNKNKKNFSSKVVFEINEVVYTVEKKGKLLPSGNVKVDIDFYYTDTNDTRISLNGDQRDSTTKNIRNYIGSYEDFILTSLSVQNNGTNFIEKPQRERRELLINFLDLIIFEELTLIASDELREIKTLIKALQSLNLEEKLNSSLTKHATLENKKQSIENQIVDLKLNQEELQREKENLLKSIQLIEDLPSLNSVQQKLDQSTKKLQELSTKILKIQNDNSIELKVAGVESELKNMDDVEELKKRFAFFEQLKGLKANLNTELKVCETNINHAMLHIDKLNVHEYDPNCVFCVKHPIVTQGQQASSLLEELNITKQSYLEKLLKVDEQLGIYKTVPELLNKISTLTNSLNQLKKDQLLLQKTLEGLINERTYVEQNIEDQKKIIEKIERAGDILEKNKQLEKRVSEYNIQIKKVKDKSSELNNQLLQIHSQISSNEALMKDCENNFSKLKQLSDDLDAYSLYLQCVKSDGIPYHLIDKILPSIEEEINDILSGIVDFRLILETDNKNINAYISYDAGLSWPVESGSGMEKFLSSLAIRTALVQHTSLPKPNFICIDEGFGVLDGDNLGSVNTLFQKMKDNFDTLFCISHIEEMRDIVDKFIFINKKNSNSHILLN